ncbi:MAG TPA: NAD(P)-dependent alcohol dehydrogenase [Cytophagales bacterium]|nr:NAD(P)-dependent alcohol dehydrogenase [Cytophagales bacterium]
MRALIVKGGYGLKHISLDEVAMPHIQQNEVLVKVGCVALNQLDLMIAKGAFGNALPHILGSDAVGEVVQVGAQVTSLQVGDIVATHFIQHWKSGRLKSSDLKSRLGTEVQGAFSEYIALPEDSFVQIPNGLTMEEASTLPIAGLTAWEALINVGHLEPGQTVLLQGTGGVSIFALQFAKVLGAGVILLSSSDEKLEKAKLLGADEVINYKKIPDWPEKVVTLTKGAGVDLALEMSWTDIDKTIAAMKMGGKIAVVGLLGGADAALSVFGILQKSLTLEGVQVGSRDTFEQMNRAMERYHIRPVIDKVFEMEDWKAAIDYMDSGVKLGKVVLRF